MNVAMRNERLVVQERMTEIYVNQLGSLQRQVEAFWTERQAALAMVAGNSPAEKFSAVMRANLAYAVVICDDHGNPVYPSAAALDAPIEDNAEWAAAREQEFQKKDYPAAITAYARIAATSRDAAFRGARRRACLSSALAGARPVRKHRQTDTTRMKRTNSPVSVCATASS